MMGDVRKPCPFCGGEDAMMGGTFRDDWMTCLDCNAAGPYCATEAEAITAWNTRAEAFEVGVVAKLVEALELADAMLSGANMDAKHIERKVRAALALARGEQA